MTDRQLVAEITRIYQEGRQASLRIGQLLEDKRQELGGTSRGGRPVRSRFWTWFEEQDFPFSRNTAENYLLFAREPERYVLHVEQVRKRSQAKQQAYEREREEQADGETVRVGLPIDLYEQLTQLAHINEHAINEELATAVREHLRRHRTKLRAVS